MKSSISKRVSVVIPAYNGSKYIGKALQSILRQTVLPEEIVVVDDGSTDETAEIVRGFGERVKYVYKLNGGVASARNLGIEVTSGHYITFLDQDDWWPDDMLKNTLLRFEENPDLEIVMGYSKIVFEEGAFRGRFGVEEDGLTAAHPLVGSALIKRNSIEKIGVFDESLPAANDVDWFNRVREATICMAVLPTITLYHRRHMDNASNDVHWLRTEMMKAMKLSLDRRRSKSFVKPLPSFDSLSENP